MSARLPLSHYSSLPLLPTHLQQLSASLTVKNILGYVFLKAKQKRAPDWVFMPILPYFFLNWQDFDTWIAPFLLWD